MSRGEKSGQNMNWKKMVKNVISRGKISKSEKLKKWTLVSYESNEIGFRNFRVILRKIWIFEDGVTPIPKISGQIWGFGQNGEKRYW